MNWKWKVFLNPPIISQNKENFEPNYGTSCYEKNWTWSLEMVIKDWRIPNKNEFQFYQTYSTKTLIHQFVNWKDFDQTPEWVDRIKMSLKL